MIYNPRLGTTITCQAKAEVDWKRANRVEVFKNRLRR
jgi:hypothetical protein